MIPYIRGRVTHQAHVAVPEGTFEEEYAREGFFGRYAHLYRTHPPVGWSSIEGDLKPRAYQLGTTEALREDFLALREVVLANKDCEIAYIQGLGRMSKFFRNADGDDLYFVHQGKGRLETDFGPLNLEPGDYLVVPRGTVHRFLMDSPGALLNVTTFSEIKMPEKGMIGQHALIDPAMIRVPTPESQPFPGTSQAVANTTSAPESYQVQIRRQGRITTVTYPYHPIDVVGWKGTLTVWQFNVKDIRPILSDRYHLPPSAHTTFLAEGVAFCTFLPRPLENGDPEAMKVPFYHSNIDYDEVLFYHQGDFFSRAGISPGMMTFHPQGIHHGPQEKAIARTAGLHRTNEVAVMIDTRFPLEPTHKATQYEKRDYWRSWMP